MVLFVVVAASVGGGISRFQQAPDGSDRAGDVSSEMSRPVNAEASPVSSNSEAYQVAGEAVSLEPLTTQSVVVDELSGESAAREVVSGHLVEESAAGSIGPAPERTTTDDPDAALKQQMLGTWEDDYKGHRILTLLEDGTGTMVVELDGFAATLFAKKLTFQEEWAVADGKVTMKATGGEPSGKVRLVLNLHGNSSTQRIAEVDSDRMVLIEEPSGTRFEWRRVANAESPQR
ncbi:MAG: hypothetical protein HQ518_05125 [Rhodopirellula sp.]|nr:hypothetical protein [Rhodopirellula sp.]